jgi:chromodomain-helicase-DNA-binding protein 1
MPSPSGPTAFPLTNGHASPADVATATASEPSAHSDSELSDVKEAAVEHPSSDEDAPGEEYDEDEDMAIASESSDDVDAEGEPDGDYDSETPPPAAEDRARSSTSQESRRPPKRKASVEEDDHMAQNPELYGLRRSVRSLYLTREPELTVPQGRARPNRRIVRYPSGWKEIFLTSCRSIVAMMRTNRTPMHHASVHVQLRAKVRRLIQINLIAMLTL